MRKFPVFIQYALNLACLAFIGLTLPLFGADNSSRQEVTEAAPAQTSAVVTIDDNNNTVESAEEAGVRSILSDDKVPPEPVKAPEEPKDLGAILNQLWRLELFNSGGAAVHLNQIVIAGLIFFIGIWISRLLTRIIGRRLAHSRNIDANTAHIVERLVFYLFLVVITLIALPLAGIPITIFTVLGGAIAIGIGFGAQNLFNNLISGLIIMIEHPIRVGDVVEVNDRRGKIAAINNRCVRVKRSDGVDVLVPNSHFLEQPVINWTLNDTDIRGEVVVGVAYGSPTETVNELLLKAACDHDQVYKKPEPIVLFEDFGDNSLVFRLLFWCRVETPMDMRIIQSNLRFVIDDLFRKSDVCISFPQRDVHLDTLSPVEIKVLKEGD